MRWFVMASFAVTVLLPVVTWGQVTDSAYYVMYEEGAAADGELYYRALGFPDKTGTMAALRPATGERVWYTPHANPTSCFDPEADWCSSGLFAVATGRRSSGACCSSEPATASDRAPRATCCSRLASSDASRSVADL